METTSENMNRNETHILNALRFSSDILDPISDGLVCCCVHRLKSAKKCCSYLAHIWII